jgi:hypothetical protein
MPLFDLLSATSIESYSYVGNVRTYVGTSNVENTTAFLAIFATPPNNPDESWIPLQASDRDIFYSIGSTNWPCLKARDGIFGRVDVSFIGNWELPRSVSPSPAEIQEHFGLPDPESGFYYFVNSRERTIMSWNAVRKHISGSYVGQWVKPNYKNLITGYDFDTRQKQKSVEIVATKTEIVRIGYYKQNKLEAIPDLISIDWMEYEYQLRKGKPAVINLMDCVFGTLYFLAGNTLELLLTGVLTPTGYYPVSSYLPQSIPLLMAEWEALRSAALPPSGSSPVIGGVYTTETITYTSGGTELKAIAANNNWWQNNPQQHEDLGYNANHPMLAVNESRSNNWHISPQTDGIGTLTMDSPRTIEIHSALDAGKYASDDSGNPRVASLGHFIERIAAMLGYRPEPDGTIDQEKERSIFARTLIKPDAGLPVGKYMAGRFGSIGMLMRRLPNRRKNGKWEAGGIVAVHDIPQLVTEVLDQLNQALNIQDSTSIQIRDGVDTYEYPNQLALLSEIATGAIQQRRQVREIWASSIVCQQSINEVIAGIGLPAVSKSITINNQKIPYWGIQPDKSLQREIATVAYNVGVATGQLL